MQRDSRGATREQVAIATGISAEGGFAGGTTRRGSLNAKQTRERGERGGLLLLADHNLENACTIIMMRNTALAKSIGHLYFFYLSGIFLSVFILFPYQHYT